MDADLRVRLYGRGFICTSCSTSSTKLRSLLLNLKGTKFGCGAGLCGACTVHLDGRAIRSCQTPVSTVASKQVTTLEGLSADGTHPPQLAWQEVDVPQCGYWQAGQIMSADELLERKAKPTARAVH